MLSFNDIAKIFETIEFKLIDTLKRNLHRHQIEEGKEGFNWSAWQAEKLKNLERFRRENIAIMNSYVDVIDDQTRQLMGEQFLEGEKLAEEAAEFAVSDDISLEVSRQPSFFGVNQSKMDALMEDITNLEKTVETAALRTIDDVYRQTVHKAQLEMATGSTTLTKAIDDAVREFLDKGINSIIYRNGRRVNIADYVRMALRTTSTRATLQGKAKRWAELGYDTVLVSQYGGCSETCEPWQGKVYIDDVFTVWNGECNGNMGKSNYCGKWFPLLSSAIKGGLFHPNCRHTLVQYIDGVTKIPNPIPAEKIAKQRELEQTQRKMEREIRRLKRFLNGTMDPNSLKVYRGKLREAQAELKKFVDEHNDVLRRDYSREKVYNATTIPPETAPALPVSVPNVSEGKSVEITVSEPEKPQGAYADERISENINTKSIDNPAESAIIKVGKQRGIDNMIAVEEKHTAAGNRRSPYYELTEKDIEFVKVEIKAIGADLNVFVFNSDITRGTCFLASDGRIHIKGNIFPDDTSTHPRDRLSVKAVLAHEYYGHRPYYEQYLKEDADISHDSMSKIAARQWADEFRASYMAAKNAPGLSDEERAMLIQDALSRAHENGVSIKYNDFIKEVLYGKYGYR